MHWRNGLAILFIVLLCAAVVKAPSHVYFKHKQTDGLTVAEGASFRLYAFGEGAAQALSQTEVCLSMTLCHPQMQKCICTQKVLAGGLAMHCQVLSEDTRGRICKRLSEESIPPAYVPWRTGTTNRIVVAARQAGNRFLSSLKGLKIRALYARMGEACCVCLCVLCVCVR